MTFGTFEFTEYGTKPFEDVYSTTSVTSVTVDINDVNGKGITLVEGLIQPTEEYYPYLSLRGSDNSVSSIKDVQYRMRRSGTTSTYNTGDNTVIRLTNHYIDNSDTEGFYFQLWFKFGENNSSNPYEDVSFHWRGLAHVTGDSSAGVAATEGQGRVRSSGDVGKARFTMSNGAIANHRIRCFNFLSS